MPWTHLAGPGLPYKGGRALWLVEVLQQQPHNIVSVPGPLVRLGGLSVLLAGLLGLEQHNAKTNAQQRGDKVPMPWSNDDNNGVQVLGQHSTAQHSTEAKGRG